MATRAAAIAVAKVATFRQRRACADDRITLEVSAAAGGSTISEATDGGAPGTTSAACASARLIADLILFQTSGRGSTEPTIWFKAPSLCCHASIIAANS